MERRTAKVGITEKHSGGHMGVHNNSGDYCEDDHSPFKEEYGNKDNT